MLYILLLKLLKIMALKDKMLVFLVSLMEETEDSQENHGPLKSDNHPSTCLHPGSDRASLACIGSIC